MREIVIDASVVVKWFIEENDSDKALFLRDSFISGKVELYVPPLLYFEVLNVLKYSQLFKPNELEDAGESLENYGFTVITIKDEIRKHMINAAIDYDLSIYDASYLGLSMGLDKLFCTADEKIIKKLPSTLRKKVKSLKLVEEIFT
ncbi:MAG: PIN domain-containing protein [Promethearchaeota archaeon]|nr:MAG: PIN domain-containing protein [Candidatus Lokiarchaeota archaeon]